MSKIIRLGMDLGKTTFPVYAMARAGHVVLAKRFTRQGVEQLRRPYEACGGRSMGRACWGRGAMPRG